MIPKLAKYQTASIEDIFNDNYASILRWAETVTKNDKFLAEDLVHDVFLKCSRSLETYVEIENVKSYLFTAIRNTYISQLRRKTLRSEIAITDETPIDTIGLAHDPRISIAVRDQLFEICYYACKRKDNSISASVLILRYFHGYYTAETKKVLKRSQNSIEARISKARTEILDHLNKSKQPVKPDAFTRIKKLSKIAHTRETDFIADLRRLIFSHSFGRCLSTTEWRRTYLKSEKISREDLSHLVSCPECLDTVNQLLRLPILAHRHPLDSRGPQSITEVLGLARIY
ncbi:MAG: RNA polymerase sigma factor [Pyrinomonadaceae bacterium]